MGTKWEQNEEPIHFWRIWTRLGELSFWTTPSVNENSDLFVNKHRYTLLPVLFAVLLALWLLL